MGINKPDVRFVFHHSVPKSLEGYMQETGRAGRDGDRADVYLMYNYGDKNKIESMIAKSDGNDGQKAVQRQQLLQMISYAENEFECRRAQMLSYFHERFDSSLCKGTCDNCLAKRGESCEQRDVSELGRSVLQLVGASWAPLTLGMAVDALKGLMNKTIKQKGLHELPGFNTAGTYKKTEVERVLKVMISKGFLAEQLHVNENFGGINAYMQFGTRSEALGGGQERLVVPFATRATRDTDQLDVQGGDAAAQRTYVDDLLDVCSAGHRSRRCMRTSPTPRACALPCHLPMRALPAADVSPPRC